MLTDLTFLDPGQKFPPPCESERLTTYAENRKLFEGDHAEIYAKQLQRIDRVIGNFGDVVNFAVVMNFQKIMSLKIADLLIGEAPKISAGDPDSAEQVSVDWIIERSDLINTAYMAGIDVSRYGDGIFYVRKEANQGIIDITQPGMWFPVVSPDNVKLIMNHVLAWTYETKSGNTKQKWLKALVHYKGYYEQRIYRMTNDTITALESSDRIILGINDFAVIPVPNIITSDRVTGMDDYKDIDSIVSELMVRIGQVDRILDKHADPSMQGPPSALERDTTTGQWRLKSGSYFVVDNEAGQTSEVKYLTWDGQLTAAFMMIEKLTNILYTISEMGSAIFGDMAGSAGAAPSGTALRRLMISPLAKVNRIRMRFDRALKKAIDLCSQLGGPNIVSLANVDISIKWQDGLPSDPLEEAGIIEKRTGGVATMSKRRVLQIYDGMSDKDADEELDQIETEEMSSTPTTVPKVGGTDFPPETEGGEA